MNGAPHPLVARYLKDLEHALYDLPRPRRREIVEEIRDHIDEAATAELSEPNEADLRAILDQVGDPESIAAEARRRFGIEHERAGLLEGSAIALLLVGGVILPGMGWIIGAVLLWVSRVWTPRDKLIGTLLFPGGLALAFFFGLLATGTSSSCETVRRGSREIQVGICSGETVGPEIWLTLLLVVLVIVPIGTAIYLGRRAWRSP